MPELHRPLAADTVPPAGQEVLVTAGAAECAVLATRLRLPAVRSLCCRFRLSPVPGAAILAEGRLDAEVVQTCVLTLEDFPATVTERFTVRFVPEGAQSDDPDPEAIDEIPCSGGVLDLGEAAAEQLALALDPYPRAPGALLPEVAEAEAKARRPRSPVWRRYGAADRGKFPVSCSTRHHVPRAAGPRNPEAGQP